MSLNASEQNLHQSLLTLVKKERDTLSQILEHLQLVNERKLYAKMGYSSIYKYLIFELGYSEGAAYRRVSALKLVKEVPEARKLIKEGKINLTNASHLQSILKDESPQTKKSALGAINGQNSKQAQVTLLSLAGITEVKPKDQQARVSATQTQLSITVSDQVLAKLDQVKAKTKIYNHGDLLDYLLEREIKRKGQLKTRQSSKKISNPRTISAQIKRDIYHRAQGHCEYPGCQEIHFLEYDHRIPLAHGGKSTHDNIRLLCKSHNQLEAVRILGTQKMKKYF